MNRLLSIILSATLPLTALADEPPAEPPHAGAKPRLRLQSREQVSMQMVIRKLLLERYDADGDGQLDGDERRRLMEDAHSARKQQALAFIRRFDADADGKLSAEEYEAMQQTMEARRDGHDRNAAGAPPPPPQAGPREPRGRRHHSPRPPHPSMGKEGRIIAFMVQQLTMDAYDADKNGILDTAESERLREEGAALYEARRAELLARYDADKDSTLSAAELRAAMQSLRPSHHAKRGGEDAPPPPHRRPHHSPVNRLLGTHFDVDILRHLAPQETPPAAPCAPSTSSTN